MIFAWSPLTVYQTRLLNGPPCAVCLHLGSRFWPMMGELKINWLSYYHGSLYNSSVSSQLATSWRSTLWSRDLAISGLEFSPVGSWFHIYPFRVINFHTKLIPESEPVFVNPLNGVIEYFCSLTACRLVISCLAFFTSKASSSLNFLWNQSSSLFCISCFLIRLTLPSVYRLGFAQE